MLGDKKTMVTEKSFRDKITITSFLCIIMVILIHTYNIEVYGISAEDVGVGCFIYWMEKFISRITSIGVPFFFIISGYLFFRTFTWNNLNNKYISRIKTIIIPYFLWNTIYYLYFASLTNISFFASKMNTERVPFDLLLWLSWLWPNKYYIFWFLQDLIVMITITPLLYLLLKNNFKYSGFIGLAVIYILSSGMLGFEIPYFNFYFVVGAFLGINYKDLPKMYSRNVTLISRVLVIILLADCAIRTYCDSDLWFVEIIAFCFAIWESFEVKDSHKALPMIMTISFFIYCSHDAVLEGVEKIMLIAIGINPIAALIDYLVAPVISLVIIWVIASILKMVPPVWKVLTGSRG